MDFNHCVVLKNWAYLGNKVAYEGTSADLIMVLLMACENPIRFEVPQPENEKNLTLIPGALIGNYFWQPDSANLLITAKCVIRWGEFWERRLVDDEDSVTLLLLKKDTTFRVEEGIIVSHITAKGDSIFIRAQLLDTLFSASRGDVLRKLKGHYFLNRKSSDGSWHVNTVTFRKDTLVLGSAFVAEYNNLIDLSGEEPDSLSHFRLSRKQMKKYIKEGGFSSESKFLKTKKAFIPL